MKAILKVLSVAGLLLSTALWLRAAEPLPPPWKHQDIGAVQMPGTAEDAAGVFTLQGTLDIWGKADGCQIAWQPLHGDGELLARVSGMKNPGGVAHAKASLCIRESLEAGSRNATLAVTAGDGTQFLCRDQTGGQTVRIMADAKSPKSVVPKKHFPCWLKIVRHGNEITGYESLDGNKWQVTGTVKLDLPADSIVGLAASSHTADVLTRAAFDHVELCTK